MQEWLGDYQHYQDQRGKDLGERMANALGNGLQEQKDTILMGSDCPEINEPILEEALTRLHDNDLVVGPAHDGGYYLIGVTKSLNPVACQELFKEMHWGSSTVFSDTLKRARNLNISVHILPTLHDIDTPEDLKHFHHSPHPQ
jgi:rSAM/selenodomain-associated transferase 1